VHYLFDYYLDFETGTPAASGGVALYRARQIKTATSAMAFDPSLASNRVILYVVLFGNQLRNSIFSP
jgi:hypothetical protein